jgi:uncharacterized membrane protein HdeD (DUF308 family)
MATNPTEFSTYRRTLLTSRRHHWVFFLVKGIVLVVLGIIAIVAPVLATLALTIFLGWLFLVSGVVGLFTTFWMRSAPGFWWSLLSAILGIAVGLLLLAAPISGAVSLTIVLIAFFIIEGIVSIMYGLDHKREATGNWGWMVLSGVVDLILAAMIFAGLPSTAAWALGLLVGINMVFSGVALIAISFRVRNAVAERPAP